MRDRNPEPKITVCKFCNNKSFLYDDLQDAIYCYKCGALLFQEVKNECKNINAVRVNTWIEKYYW